MDQFEFECIIQLIKIGAPALADRLCKALINLIESEATLKLTVQNIQNDRKEENDGVR